MPDMQLIGPSQQCTRIPPNLTQGYTFKTATDGFQYLGIFITPDPKVFY